MSTGGSMTHPAFKKSQLDHLINVILETAGDPDHDTIILLINTPLIMLKTI